jgi:hypothetical protein
MAELKKSLQITDRYMRNTEAERMKAPKSIWEIYVAEKAIAACAFALMISGTASCADSDSPSETYGSGKKDLISIYQDVISPAKGHTCPMYPSCSQYARMAFSRDFPPRAFARTCDRLMRCGNDAQTYKRMPFDGRMFDSPIREAFPDSLEPTVSLLRRKVLFPDSFAILPDSGLCSTAFARYLISQNQYSLAQSEYYRLLYCGEDSLHREEILLELASSFLMKGDYDGFLGVLRTSVLEADLGDSCRFRFDLLTAKCYYLRGDFGASRAILGLHDSIGLGNAIGDEYAFMSALNSARQHQWSEVRSRCALVSPASARAAAVHALAAIDSSTRPRLKNAWLAGTLSAVIPGAGYWYVNKKGTAITALLVNGLFIWTGVEAIGKKNYGLGASVILLGNGWYFGNIYGAAAAAHRYNMTIVDSEIDNALFSF